MSDNYVVLDAETTTINKGDPLNPDNRLLLFVWKLGRTGEVKHCFGNEFEQYDLLDDIASADFIVAHNAKFDLQWLARCGLNLRTVLPYDTMIGDYVRAGNRPWSFDMDSVANRYNAGRKSDLVNAWIKQGNNPIDLPKRLLLSYCRNDVLVTEKILLAQRSYLMDNGLMPVMYSRCITTPALADIEAQGMTLDKDRVFDEVNKHEDRLAEITAELEELAGEINLNSPQQLAEFLYETLGFKEITDSKGNPIRNQPSKRFPDGAPKTDVTTLSQLKAKTKEQRRFLELYDEYNSVNTALTKNLNFFREVCETYGSRFYGQFNQTVTRTHRLSSSGRKLKMSDGKYKGCQFQNFPRRFKNLFTSSAAGRAIGEVDGSQLEFRVAGHLGRDEVVYHDVVNQVDIHSFTADTLTQAGEPTSRQEAKASTFRPLYGGSSGTPAVQAYCESFRDKYKALAETQWGWTQTVLASKQLRTEWGLVYYWPDTTLSKSGYISNTTSIYNYPVQAFATAEIIPIALTHFWHRSDGDAIKVINTIHDSIIVDIDEEAANEFAILSAQCMIEDVKRFIKDLYGIELYVPLGCGIKIGDHWSEGKIIPDVKDDLSIDYDVKVDGTELVLNDTKGLTKNKTKEIV